MSTDCIIWAITMYACGLGFLFSYLILLWEALLALDDKSRRMSARKWAMATNAFLVIGSISLMMVYRIIPCASN